jgi:YgiT-type zinc finger domain-containing protein
MSSKIVDSATTQLYEENGHLVIIKDIPCLRCEECGETYLTTPVMKAVENFLNSVTFAELEIVSFGKLAA